MKTLTILTIVFNFFIFIGAGHGIGFLGLIEIMAINEIFLGNFTFDLTGSYDDRLPVVAILSIIGQSLLLIGFCINETAKAKLTIIGCLILLIATYILTKDSGDMNLDMISLIFSVPFLLTASTLLIKEFLAIKRIGTTLE